MLPQHSAMLSSLSPILVRVIGVFSGLLSNWLGRSSHKIVDIEMQTSYFENTVSKRNSPQQQFHNTQLSDDDSLVLGVDESSRQRFIKTMTAQTVRESYLQTLITLNRSISVFNFVPYRLEMTLHRLLGL